MKLKWTTFIKNLPLIFLETSCNDDQPYWTSIRIIYIMDQHVLNFSVGPDPFGIVVSTHKNTLKVVVAIQGLGDQPGSIVILEFPSGSLAGDYTLKRLTFDKFQKQYVFYRDDIMHIDKYIYDTTSCVSMLKLCVCAWAYVRVCSLWWLSYYLISVETILYLYLHKLISFYRLK